MEKFKSALVVLVAGLFAGAAPFAQPPAFDVVSIKRTDVNDTRPGADFGAQPGGRLVARNNAVSNFITNAYDIPGYLVVGGPEWMGADRYNMEARAAGEPSRPQMMLMLQTLLAERFQLRVRREVREMPAYVLTVARGGAKLTPSKDGACLERDPSKPIPPPASGAAASRLCGNNNMNSRVSPPNMTWTAFRIDMSRVAGALANYFRRPVVDRTGLAGFFDIQIDLPPLQPAAATDAGVADSGASVFTVLQEQLGLRVEDGNGPVEVLVVDSIERPTEN